MSEPDPDALACKPQWLLAWPPGEPLPFRFRAMESETCCWCCAEPNAPRGASDPWEGRMDGYCEACALARCDAYPFDCPNSGAGYTDEGTPQ